MKAKYVNEAIMKKLIVVFGKLEYFLSREGGTHAVRAEHEILNQ